jgi:hypothetical protein
MRLKRCMAFVAALGAYLDEIGNGRTRRHFSAGRATSSEQGTIDGGDVRICPLAYSNNSRSTCAKATPCAGFTSVLSAVHPIVFDSSASSIYNVDHRTDRRTLADALFDGIACVLRGRLELALVAR